MGHSEGHGVPTHMVVLLRICTQIRKRQSKQSLEKRKSSASGKVRDRVHPVSFVIQHLRRENNERRFGQIGRGIGIGGRVVTNLRYWRVDSGWENRGDGNRLHRIIDTK